MIECVVPLRFIGVTPSPTPRPFGNSSVASHFPFKGLDWI